VPIATPTPTTAICSLVGGYHCFGVPSFLGLVVGLFIAIAIGFMVLPTASGKGLLDSTL